mmetsp:Transcript_31364/g.66306  ORF Transcript_31364/g.66306 Transcript_31364/m.66306 type:complete len:125 (-) Transcript_31364:531-905(-)
MEAFTTDVFGTKYSLSHKQDIGWDSATQDHNCNEGSIDRDGRNLGNILASSGKETGPAFQFLPSIQIQFYWGRVLPSAPTSDDTATPHSFNAQICINISIIHRSFGRHNRLNDNISFVQFIEKI